MLSTSQRVASRYALTASFHAPQTYRYAPHAGTRSTMSGQPVESAIAAWIRAQTVDTLTLPASSAHPATTTLRQCIVDALDAPSEDHQRIDTITTVLRLRKDLAMAFAGDAHWTCVAHARLLVDSLDDNEPDSGGPLHARIIDATAEELRHPVDGLRALVDWRADVLVGF